MQDLKLAGVPIEPAADYRFTVNSFLADGGDNYTVFRDGTNRVAGNVDTDAFENFLKANPGGITYAAFKAPLVVTTPTARLELAQQEFGWMGLYGGALLAMLLYNLMLFLSLRDRSHLYYVGYLTVFGVAQLTLNGMAFQYLWPTHPDWGNWALPVCMSAAGLPEPVIATGPATAGQAAALLLHGTGRERPPLAAHCLTPALAAGEATLDQQLRAWGHPGDVWLVFSMEREERDLKAATATARELDMTLVVFSGEAAQTLGPLLRDTDVWVPLPGARAAILFATAWLALDGLCHAVDATLLGDTAA